MTDTTLHWGALVVVVILMLIGFYFTVEQGSRNERIFGAVLDAASTLTTP